MKNYIFIDESPSLSKNDNFDYFCLSCYLVKDEEDIIKLRRIPKKIKNKKLKKKYKKESELKFSNSPTNIRKFFLEEVNKIDIEIFCLVIDKRKTKNHLQDNLPVFYNYLTNILLEKVLPFLDLDKGIELNFDRCMNKIQISNLENYLNSKFLELFSKVSNVNIKHLDSSQEKCLQAIDFIAGSFRFEYNEKSTIYTDIFKSKIRIIKDDLFKEV